MAEPASVGVTFVVPVLNEEHYIGSAVESILAQDGCTGSPILLVRGRSTDGTNAIIDGLCARHPEVSVIENPDNGISIALNKGFAAATTDVVVRVDAHSVLPADYTRRMLAAITRADAVNVGGRMLAEGLSPFQRAVAWAYNSPAGLGGGVYHVGGDAGPAESAYLGVFRRDAVLAVGGFDEHLSRGEDWELNFRLRRAGGTVWFEPRVEVIYRPRSTVRALAKQFFASGRWRGELIRRFPGHNGLRFYLPPLLVVSLAVAIGAGIAAFFTHGNAAVAWTAAGALPGIAYAGWLILAVVGARGLPWPSRALLPVVLPVMHLSWGGGCLLGLVRPTRGLNAFSGR